MSAGFAVDVFVDPSKLTLTSAVAVHSTTTATMTVASHGFSVSDTVKVLGADQAEYNGNFVISNVTTNTFDYTMSADPLADATGTLTCSKLNLAGDDGTTDALAYADLDYATSQSTYSTGLQFNLKSGSVNTLTGTYRCKSGSGSKDAFILRGYDSEPDDGGVGVIDGAGLYGISPIDSNNTFIDLEIRNSGAELLLSLGSSADRTAVFNCEIHDAENGVSISQSAIYMTLKGNYIHDISEVGIKTYSSRTRIDGNFLKNGATKKFTHAVDALYDYPTVVNNLVWVDSTSNGINAVGNSSNSCQNFENNSVYSDGGSGIGLAFHGNNVNSSLMLNNVVEGFTTGTGIQAGSWGGEIGKAVNNTASLNGTNLDIGSASTLNEGNVESSSDELFAKSGSLPTNFTAASFWSSVYAWFAPNNVGSIWGGSAWSNRDRGAVEHREVTPSRHPLARF